MRIERRLTRPEEDPYESLSFESRTSRIVNPDGSVAFEADDILVPARWSQVATDILAQKYCRKAGVPRALKKTEEKDVPDWLQRSEPDEEALKELPESERTGMESDSRVVFDRLAGCWTY
jgi:ribonucleoside-diphosphate reductase alpha chain